MLYCGSRFQPRRMRRCSTVKFSCTLRPLHHKRRRDFDLSPSPLGVLAPGANHCAVALPTRRSSARGVSLQYDRGESAADEFALAGQLRPDDGKSEATDCTRDEVRGVFRELASKLPKNLKISFWKHVLCTVAVALRLQFTRRRRIPSLVEGRRGVQLDTRGPMPPRSCDRVRSRDDA
jgi:hypothetical protein